MTHFEKGTVCLCPKCGRKHKVKIHWVGRGIPRIYCRRCRSYVARFCYETYNSQNHRRSAKVLD